MSVGDKAEARLQHLSDGGVRPGAELKSHDRFIAPLPNLFLHYLTNTAFFVFFDFYLGVARNAYKGISAQVHAAVKRLDIATNNLVKRCKNLVPGRDVGGQRNPLLQYGRNLHSRIKGF